MEELNKLSKKIEKLKKKSDPIKSNNIIHKSASMNYSIAINISIELITGIGIGVFFGLMLDNYLQTKPIMFIIFFLLGTIVGFYNMYKTLKKYKFF